MNTGKFIDNTGKIRNINISKLVEHIKIILENDPKARDNDHRLECIIYSKLYKIDLEKTNVFDFYTMLMHKKIPNSSSIRRARRKCQELYWDTRGSKYTKRQEKQSQVKDELQDAKLNSSNPSWY